MSKSSTVKKFSLDKYMNDATLCGKCHVNKGQDSHTCPFKVEINNDSATKCRCCNECRHECAMDV